MTRLRARVKKAEENMLALALDDRQYIDAIKKYCSGQDDGETLARLPSLIDTDPKHRLTVLCIRAFNELDPGKRGTR